MENVVFKFLCSIVNGAVEHLTIHAFCRPLNNLLVLKFSKLFWKSGDTFDNNIKLGNDATEPPHMSVTLLVLVVNS